MTEHLIVLPDRDDAERLADELRQEGFTEVRVVREALAGEDDSEDHEWAIYVREEMVDDDTGPVAEGLVVSARARCACMLMALLADGLDANGLQHATCA